MLACPVWPKDPFQDQVGVKVQKKKDVDFRRNRCENGRMAPASAAPLGPHPSSSWQQSHSSRIQPRPHGSRPHFPQLSSLPCRAPFLSQGALLSKQFCGQQLESYFRDKLAAQHLY